MSTFIDVSRLHRSRIRHHAVILILVLLSTPIFSQVKKTYEGSLCTAQVTVASGQIIDTVINLKILLVQFTDVRCRMDADGTSPRYTSADFENLLGSEGVYVSPGMHSPDGDELFGSMNDYFINMSGGRMRIHAFVINRRDSLTGKPVWITLGLTKQQYQETSDNIFSDSRFAAFDAGLDTSVSGNTRLVTIYAGNTYFLKGGLNPKACESCYIMSEVQGRPYNEERTDAKFSRIGLHCHEFAHTLGIGHTTGGRADVMYGGTSNGSVEGNAPAPFNAIVRAREGWAAVIPAGSTGSQGVALPYSLTNPTVYLMKNSEGDLFYIENRRFDQTMTIGTTVVPDYNNVDFFPPAGPHHAISQGIFVWRVTTTDDIHDPGYSSQGLVYASGRYGRTFPENEASDTDDGDPFPGVSNNRLLTPWSDPRSPYIPEVDDFNPTLFRYTLYVPNTKGGSNCAMEVLSEDRTGGTFRVRFYDSNPPNPAIAHLPGSDSEGFHDSRRTIIRPDSVSIHQVAELGGEIFYRRSTDHGLSWSPASPLSSGMGGNSTPCMTLAGPALLVTWQMETTDAVDSERTINLVRSTDGGKSWSDLVCLGWSERCSAPGAYPTLAGAKDGSALLVYRKDRSSLVSKCSRDGGITWSSASPVSAEEVSWESQSLAIRDHVAGAFLAYIGDTTFGVPQVMLDRFAPGTGAWGITGTASGTLPRQYSGFRNPTIVPSATDSSTALNLSWDAVDTYSGGIPVIISRRVDVAHMGTSCTVVEGVSQNEFSSAQSLLPFGASHGVSSFRLLSVIDSASGASVNVEVGVVQRISGTGKIDTIRFADTPLDCLILDVPGLIRACSSLPFAPPPEADTLRVMTAIYGHSAGSLFADGRVGFEIVRQPGDSAIAQFGVQSALSVRDGVRRLVLYSIPVASFARLAQGKALFVRPIVSGIKQDGRFTAFLGKVYSTVSENPVERIVAGFDNTNLPQALPSTFALDQNYPNPFNPSTTIRYSVPGKMHVSMSVYNTLGQKVALLVDGVQEAGIHEVRFEAGNIASGAYFYRIQAGTYSQTRRFLLIR